MRGRLIKARNIVERQGAVAVGRDAVLSAHGHVPEPEATIRMRRDGDRVVAIEVGCPCGRQHEFECLYDATVSPAIPVATHAPGEGT